MSGLQMTIRRSTVLGLITAGIGAWCGITTYFPGRHWTIWERHLEDSLLQLRGARKAPEEVVVIAIDDATLQQAEWFAGDQNAPAWARGLTRWPWPRETYGRLTQKLLDAGAAAIAINVVFTGASSSGEKDDANFNAILKQSKNQVALAAEALEGHDPIAGMAINLIRPDQFLNSINGMQSLGLTNFAMPKPGERLMHPEAYIRGISESFNLNLPSSLSTTLLNKAGLESRQIDRKTAINLYGHEPQFNRISAWEVLDPERWQKRIEHEKVKDAVVIIGPTNASLTRTAYGEFSGLELLATATGNSLQGIGLQQWPSKPWLRAIIAILPIAIAGSGALILKTLKWKIGVIGGCLAVQCVAAVMAFQVGNRWIPLLTPSTGLVLLAIVHSANAYQVEGAKRKRLRRTFERYVAPSVVAEILKRPDDVEGILRGHITNVTVLFSDIKGFTELTRSRSLRGESELHIRQLNHYLEAMVEVINTHGGTVDKFIGDAIMAVFGSPVGHGTQEDARTAAHCAIAMTKRLDQLNTEWRTENLKELGCGIGLASGPVMTGEIGSSQRMDFTVIGDTVNLASRLESQTRPLNCKVCVDKATSELVSDSPNLVFTSFGHVDIKGMGPTEVFSLTETDKHLSQTPEDTAQTN